MNSGQILIVSDDAEFVRALSARWRTEKDSPSITAVSTNVSGQANPSGQREAYRYARHAASSGNRRWNSITERGGA